MKNDVNIKTFKTDELMPAGYNPRIQTERGVKHLNASLKRFGYVDPIIVNERTMRIVGGHQRFSVLVRQGLKEIDCVTVNLSDAQEKALNITLNKTGEFFEWDVKKLQGILNEMGDEDFDSMGFDEAEVADFDVNEFLGYTEAMETRMEQRPDDFINCPYCKAHVKKKV